MIMMILMIISTHMIELALDNDNDVTYYYLNSHDRVGSQMEDLYLIGMSKGGEAGKPSVLQTEYYN